MMSGRILIAYVSRHGLDSRDLPVCRKRTGVPGNTVEVVEMKTIPPLAGHHAIVIGAPLYIGRMVGDVEQRSDINMRFELLLYRKNGLGEYHMEKLHSMLTPRASSGDFPLRWQTGSNTSLVHLLNV